MSDPLDKVVPHTVLPCNCRNHGCNGVRFMISEDVVKQALEDAALVVESQKGKG